MPDKEGELPVLHEPQVEKGSRWLPSLVWLVPLLAALIGLGFGDFGEYRHGCNRWPAEWP
eukprot:gene31599-35677_t